MSEASTHGVARRVELLGTEDAFIAISRDEFERQARGTLD
jgi:hypothetical protein